MKILIWNVQWAKPGNKRDLIIQRIIAEESPDIICITEGYLQSWSTHKHVIASHEDYGYRIHEGRRKVILISKTPWEESDDFGDSGFPSGRFVSGLTAGVNFVGVCIPWSEVHVSTGKKNRKRWEDHLDYLSALKNYIGKSDSEMFVLGDFNQRIPRKRNTIKAFESLQAALEDFAIWTEGSIEPIGKQTIDHFATRNTGKTFSVRSIDSTQDGVTLSDHFGLVITVEG
jgi:exonuclease III